MRTHIQILAWIYLILGGLAALRGVLSMIAMYLFQFLFVATAPGAFDTGTRVTGASIAVVGAYVGLIWLCLGLSSVFAGWGLLKRRQWGRILGIVVSVLCLPLGIYGLIVLLQPKAAREFS